MTQLIAVFTFTGTFLLILLLYNFIFKERRQMEKRIADIAGRTMHTVREQELKVPFFKRAVKPLLDKIYQLISKVLPTEKEAELAKKIIGAGIGHKIAPRELLVFKYLAAGGIAAFLFMFGAVAGKGTAQAIAIGLAGIGLGWFLPDLYLNRKESVRKQEIEKSLPDILDLLTVSVEAGLGFDGALMKVVEKTKGGVLSEEFFIVLQEIKMGKPRAEALRDMSGRTGVDDLSKFTGSVILADRLGISIGNILRLQSGQIRQKCRQKAEEKAMKAPVKMLIPIVLFIFPALFVVLLGPAAIQITKHFLN